MEEPLKQADQTAQERQFISPEDRYYQRIKDINATSLHWRQEIWGLHQELQAHHLIVQSCYEALTEAISRGEEHETLWYEYHKAITQHRLLVNRFRLAMQQRLLGMFSRPDSDKLP